MTNRELLRTPNENLSELDRQTKFLLQKEMTAVPCPVCKKPLDALTAAGIDIDQYDATRTKDQYRCPDCQAELELVVPFVAFGPGWHWQPRHEWLTAMLDKARLYGREHPTTKESP
jgi:hypothetical protein